MADGRICFLVWRGLSECGTLDATHAMFWGINGGNRKRGQAVVGVVADKVHAVDVRLGTRRVRASVRHNAFVVPFRTARTANDPQVRVAAVLR